MFVNKSNTLLDFYIGKMSKFQPNNQHFHEALLLLFNLKNTTSKSHRLLVQAYGERAPSEQICHEIFRSLKSDCTSQSNKQHIRESMIFLFHLNKKAAVGHRKLEDAYGAGAPSLKTCQEWYRRFKSGDFHLEDKERTGRPKAFEDKELQELLDADPYCSRGKLAEALNISKSSMSKRLKAIGVVYKEGKWVPKTEADNSFNE